MSLDNTYKEMVASLKKPSDAIHSEISSQDCDVIHMIMGICGEAGELLDAIKKSVIYKKPLDIENVIEELGDIEFYLEGFRQIFDIPREATLESNIQKLLKGKNARYAKGTYSDTDAQIRADKS